MPTPAREEAPGRRIAETKERGNMTELEQYRQEIDRIDGELVQLFLER